MVELIDAVILDNLAPKEGVTLSFDVGLNEISYEKRYIFNFLLLRNQALDGGKFVVNNKTIVPLEEAGTSLFLLAVNSQNISMSACFELGKDNKKDEIKNIQQELIDLRDMPLNTNLERITKLDRIFEILEKHKCAYVLINQGNDINKSSQALITSVLADHAMKLTIISLDDKNKVTKVPESKDELDLEVLPKKQTSPVVEEPKPTSYQTYEQNVSTYQTKPTRYTQPLEELIDDNPDAYDYLEVGDADSFVHQAPKKNKKKKSFPSLFGDKKEKPVKEERPTTPTSQTITNKDNSEKKKGIDFNYIKRLFKKEWSSFLFVLYGTLSTVFFFVVMSYQVSVKTTEDANTALLVLSLIGGILCFVVTLFIESSLYEFMDKTPYSKKHFWYATFFTELFTLLGIGLAVALASILANAGSGGVLILKEYYNPKQLIVGIVFGILSLFIPTFIKYFRRLTNKVKATFKKDKD